MENKKLLKYLLNDLSELNEMFTEKGKNCFNEMEMEFIQNRITGAKKLVQLFIDYESEGIADVKSNKGYQPKIELQKESLIQSKVEEKVHGIVTEEKTVQIQIDKKISGIVVSEEKSRIIEEEIQLPDKEDAESETVKKSVVEIQDQPLDELPKHVDKLGVVAGKKELQMEDEEPVDFHNKRLGDSFSKEKSVNDLMSDDFSKLEHKLSNRPVTSIQSAIGINDRFQYIRELFEGRTDDFVKTVSDLDSMSDIKEAVDYLQNNFKWKKNETSLKFVNLIKRRFPNE